MKKGFTLVEVLGVIAVLGLVVGIIYPLMDEILSNNANKLYENQIKSLEHQAENYFNSKINEYDLSKDFTLCITIDELYKAGLLTTNEIKNPIDNTNLQGEIKVTYQTTNSNPTYKYSDRCD